MDHFAGMSGAPQTRTRRLLVLIATALLVILGSAGASRTNIGVPAVLAQDAVAAQPVIEDGAQFIGAHPSVSVSFPTVSGAPDQVRWRWGAPPTDTASDSVGWQSFANPLTVSLPMWLLQGCTPATLYTQVRKATSGLTGALSTASTTIDGGVQATVKVENPNLRRSENFTPLADGRTSDSSDGASDGDPAYTRLPIVFIGIDGAEECSGIKEFSFGRSATSQGRSYAVTDNRFANVLANPFQGPGSNQIVVRVRDKVDNVRDSLFTVIYDPVKPTLIGGNLTVTPANPNATALINLTLTNVSVADDLYPGGFWGVWVANSREPVADLGSSALIWTPLKVAQSGGAFIVPGWDVRRGLAPQSVGAGDYYVYLRFLDGAGNPSDDSLEAQITLTRITYPAAYLPQITR